MGGVLSTAFPRQQCPFLTPFSRCQGSERRGKRGWHSGFGAVRIWAGLCMACEEIASDFMTHHSILSLKPLSILLAGSAGEQHSADGGLMGDLSKRER